MAVGPEVDLLECVHSECLRDLATVVAVVGEQPQEHRLAGMELELAGDLSTEFVL